MMSRLVTMKKPDAKHVFRFSKQRLAEIKPPKKGPLILHDTQEPALKAHLQASGKISYFYRHAFRGKCVRKFLGFAGELTPDEARRLVTTYRMAHAQGKDPGRSAEDFDSKFTFWDGFNAFMERYSKKEKDSWRHDEREVRKHCGHWFKRPLGSITKQDVQKLVEYTGDKSGKAQANHILERVRAIYNKLIQWGYEGPNPTNGIPKYRTNKRTRFLSMEELRRLLEGLEETPHPHLADVVHLALLTGARKSNIHAMAWEQVNWELQTWEIPITKNKEPHSIPLANELLVRLAKRFGRMGGKMDERGVVQKFPPDTEDQDAHWVFPSAGTRSGHVEDLRGAWHSLLEGAGIVNFHFHDLRHTFASYQAMNGTSVPILAQGLGHKSFQSTQRYAQIGNSAVRQSIQGLATTVLAFGKEHRGN
jgi:integrase